MENSRNQKLAMPIPACIPIPNSSFSLLTLSPPSLNPMTAGMSKISPTTVGHPQDPLRHSKRAQGIPRRPEAPCDARTGTHPIVGAWFPELGRPVREARLRGHWHGHMAVQQVGVLGGQNSVFDLAREAPHVDHVGGGATAEEGGECVPLPLSLYLSSFFSSDFRCFINFPALLLSHILFWSISFLSFSSIHLFPVLHIDRVLLSIFPFLFLTFRLPLSFLIFSTSSTPPPLFASPAFSHHRRVLAGALIQGGGSILRLTTRKHSRTFLFTHSLSPVMRGQRSGRSTRLPSRRSRTRKKRLP